MVGEGGAEFDDVGAVGADGLVEEVSGDVELLGPIGDVGGDFGVDLGLAGGDFVAVLGFGSSMGAALAMMSDIRSSFRVSLRWMRMVGVGMSSGTRS